MFKAVERMIAWRYLRARRKEGFISVISMFSLLGIALGVATLIVVMAVMDGFRTELTSKILGLGGHISVQSYEKGMLGYDILAKQLEKTGEVKMALPVMEGQVMASTKFGNVGAILKGMRIEDIERKPLIAKHIENGSLQDLAASNAVMLGVHLANTLGITVGDQVTLISPETNATVLGRIPRMKTYTAVALFESGMYEHDSHVIYLSLKSAQLLFQLPDMVSHLEVFIGSPDNSDKVNEAIRKETKGLYQVRDWKMSNLSLFNALQVERNVMFLILTLIVIVAAFNIISGLVMLVNDKHSDIAILRTMGATKGMVMRIFFLCGSSIGVAGTCLGVLLGVSFAANIETIRQWLMQLTGVALFDPVIYFLSELPAEIQSGDVINVALMALGLSFLATLYPAWKASRLNPAEALRYE